MTHPCAECGRTLRLQVRSGSLTADGRIVLNLPGLVCPACVDGVLDHVPDPPGLVCVNEITEEIAGSALLSMAFIRGATQAVDFFVTLFPRASHVLDTAAVRLHQHGEDGRAYELLERGITDSDNPDRLRIEMAAFLGMDGRAESGLDVLADVVDTAGPYHLIKGNLLRALGRWDEAAKCWEKAIAEEEPRTIAWNNLGYYLTQIKQDYPVAERHYRAACSIFPQERRFRAHLGDALFFQGRKQDALAEYEAALRIPDSDMTFEASLRRMMSFC